MCAHQPPCPPAAAPDRDAARVVVRHPEQGWSLLCNGVIAFEDGGDLLPDGAMTAPAWRTALCPASTRPATRRPATPLCTATAPTG